MGEEVSQRRVSRRALLFGALTAPPRPGRALVAGGPAILSYEERHRVREQVATPPSARVIAIVDIENCLPFCSICAEQCPVPNAIRLQSGHVAIDKDLCNGCGACTSVCPSPTVPIRIQSLDVEPRTDLVPERDGF